MNTTAIKNFLKDNKKTLLIVESVLLVALIVFFWRKRKGINLEEMSLAEEYTGLQTTSGMNWRDLADRLMSAFQGPNSSGTDEAGVYYVLGSLRNQSDWEYLKRYWSLYYETIPSWRIFVGSLKKSLVVMLKYELDENELDQCRLILENKGITPDF